MFLVMEYVDSSKRTLVGNLGLALFLTLSGVYQPWAMKSEMSFYFILDYSFLLQVSRRLEDVQLGDVQPDGHDSLCSFYFTRVFPLADDEGERREVAHCLEKNSKAE